MALRNEKWAGSLTEPTHRVNPSIRPLRYGQVLPKFASTLVTSEKLTNPS